MSIFGLRAYSYYGELKGSGTYNKISTWAAIPEYSTINASDGAGITYTINTSNVFYPNVFSGASYFYLNLKDKDGNRIPRNSAME